jgi:hypothetical protein
MTPSEALRPFTAGVATGYSFHTSDATGFPRALPPVRKIGLGRRALAGLMPSAKGGLGGPARFESSLERDFFVLLEFNGDVVRWDPQPIRLQVDETGRDYVPDVLVSFAGVEGSLDPIERVLYEVKYRDDLRQHWPAYRARFKAARRYARAQGWKFRIITEREIRGGGLLWNAKFLLPYLYDGIQNGERDLLLQSLIRLGPTSPRRLLEACSSDHWERARLLTAFWHLVACREVGTDLRLRLTMDSVVWCHE